VEKSFFSPSVTRNCLSFDRFGHVAPSEDDLNKNRPLFSFRENGRMAVSADGDSAAFSARPRPAGHTACVGNLNL